MDKENFVQNIKFFCEKRKVKPTVACREAGVGTSFINNIEKRRQTPSVEKVEMLAHYLGVTVSELLGETSPQPKRVDLDKELVLYDFMAPSNPPNVVRLTVSEVEMVLAYREASADDKMIVDTALRKYKKKGSAAHGGG